MIGAEGNRGEAMDVQSAVMEIFREDLQVEVPSAETDLFAEGIVDSSMFIDLLMQIEDRFGIRASLEELEPENFATVALIARFVETRSPAGVT
ncbi:MAG: acyl carrier protein [Alphaproteobacteria bacterium]